MKNLACILCSLFMSLAMTTTIIAQEKIQSYFSLQAGLGTEILDNDLGPTVSAHYAIRTDKTFQFESQLFFNKRVGTEFISGRGVRTTEFGVALGTRFNILAGKKWNPSIAVMPTLSYTSKLNPDEVNEGSKGFFAGLNAELSNTIHHHHMISVGTLWTAFPNMSIYLKYGYCF